MPISAGSVIPGVYDRVMVFDVGPDPVVDLSAVVAGGDPDAVTAVLDGLSDVELRAALVEVEVVHRRVGFAQTALMEQLETRDLDVADGHFGAKAMVRHCARLSTGEAAGRDKTRLMLRHLPEVRRAYAAGVIGTDQVRLLGRIHANRRVATEMAAHDSWFVEQAQSLSYADFEQVVRQWERLMDQDGARPRTERCHDRRDFKLSHDPFDLSWDIRGSIGSLAGAAMDEIFSHYLEAEWQTDWDKARAEHGDNATIADLARTDAQRRADALWQIFQDAASTPVDANTPRFVHNIIWDQASFQQMLQQLGTTTGEPLDPETFRCETIDGTPISATEAINNALITEFRRVVVDARGVVIDMGSARCFTGLARLAVQVQAKHCVWAGCLIPTSRCEIDHLQPHARQGSTNPGNGAPLCGRHNRWKQKGFRIWRDPTGTWHTHRPNGTEI